MQGSVIMLLSINRIARNQILVQSKAFTRLLVLTSSSFNFFATTLDIVKGNQQDATYKEVLQYVGYLGNTQHVRNQLWKTNAKKFTSSLP